MTRSEILDAARSIVTGEREKQYGKPEDNFATIGKLWEIYLRGRCVGGDAENENMSKYSGGKNDAQRAK